MKRTEGSRRGRVSIFAAGAIGVLAAGLAWAAYADERSDYLPPVAVGRIEADELKESSGLAASECQDVLWTHNDAGNEAVIFAMSTRGKHLGAWRVAGAKNIDWESIAGYRDAAGKCFLLIGDIGDNDAARREIQIYRIHEPVITNGTPAAPAADAPETAAAELMVLTYPDGPHNAETLLIHPRSADIYIVTKEKSGPAAVHRARAAFGSGGTVKTERIESVAVPSSPEGLITGGSFSPDGRRVILCDLRGGYEFILPAGATEPDAIWRQKPVTVDIGSRKQGEGVSYARDGASLFASSEKRNAPLFQIKRRSAH